MIATPIAVAGSTSLLRRISGMIWSPRTTLERVAVRPAWFGMLLVPITVTSDRQFHVPEHLGRPAGAVGATDRFIEDLGPATSGALGCQ